MFVKLIIFENILGGAKIFDRQIFESPTVDFNFIVLAIQFYKFKTI
jgi:hypothetical protein